MNDLDRAIKYYETAKVKNIHINGSTIINMLNLLQSLKENNELQTLLKDIFNDITKDNRLSPDTFDRLVEEIKP